MHYSKLLLLLLLIPTLLSGQVLKQLNEEETGLSDPNDFPFGAYLFFGFPGGGLAYDFGYNNLHKSFQSQGIDLQRSHTLNYFGTGFRYKRLNLEFSIGNQFIVPEPNFFPENRFAVLSTRSVATVSAGVAVWQNRNSAFLLRVGMGQTTISHTPSLFGSSGEVDFNDLSKGGGPTQFPQVFHRGTIVDVAIEILEGRAKQRTSLSESVRLGYRFGISDVAWQAVNASAINAPSDRIGELYMQLNFNLGVNFPKKK